MSENSTVANLCSPALVYLCFSLIQIIIDVYKKQFNTAFFKFWVMLVITTLLNILCERGLSVVSWLIVFVPIIFMTIIIVILIYFLGFKPGQANKIFNVKNEPSGIRQQMAINEMYKQQQTMASDKLNDKDALETDVSEITTVNNNNTTQNAKQEIMQPESFYSY